MKPTDIEKTNLESHVEMCAIRYAELDNRLLTLEQKMSIVTKEIVEGKNSLSKVIISSTAMIISSVVGIIVTILVKF